MLGLVGPAGTRDRDQEENCGDLQQTEFRVHRVNLDLDSIKVCRSPAGTTLAGVSRHSCLPSRRECLPRGSGLRRIPHCYAIGFAAICQDILSLRWFRPLLLKASHGRRPTQGTAAEPALTQFHQWAYATLARFAPARHAAPLF